MVLASNSLGMPCPGQSQSRLFRTSRSMVVFTQPNSPNRTNCHFVVFRVFRVETICAFEVLVSPGCGVSVANASVGITKKALFLLLMVILRLCPKHREWDFRLPQDQDRSLILVVHTCIAGCPGGQRHRAK